MPIGNEEVSLTELYYTYPMSIIVSKSHEKNHKIVYFSYLFFYKVYKDTIDPLEED